MLMFLIFNPSLPATTTHRFAAFPGCVCVFHHVCIILPRRRPRLSPHLLVVGWLRQLLFLKSLLIDHMHSAWCTHCLFFLSFSFSTASSPHAARRLIRIQMPALAAATRTTRTTWTAGASHRECESWSQYPILLSKWTVMKWLESSGVKSKNAYVCFC